MSNFTHSPVLFVEEDGNPMTFSKRLYKKSDLKDIIEHGGGILRVTDAPGAIRLVDLNSKALNVAPSTRLISLQFIYDCVKANRLLNLNDYAVKLSELDTSDISDADNAPSLAYNSKSNPHKTKKNNLAISPSSKTLHKNNRRKENKIVSNLSKPIITTSKSSKVPSAPQNVALEAQPKETRLMHDPAPNVKKPHNLVRPTHPLTSKVYCSLDNATKMFINDNGKVMVLENKPIPTKGSQSINPALNHDFAPEKGKKNSIPIVTNGLSIKTTAEVHDRPDEKNEVSPMSKNVQQLQNDRLLFMNKSSQFVQKIEIASKKGKVSEIVPQLENQKTIQLRPRGQCIVNLRTRNAPTVNLKLAPNCYLQKISDANNKHTVTKNVPLILKPSSTDSLLQSIKNSKVSSIAVGGVVSNSVLQSSKRNYSQKKDTNINHGTITENIIPILSEPSQTKTVRKTSDNVVSNSVLQSSKISHSRKKDCNVNHGTVTENIPIISEPSQTETVRRTSDNGPSCMSNAEFNEHTIEVQKNVGTIVSKSKAAIPVNKVVKLYENYVQNSLVLPDSLEVITEPAQGSFAGIEPKLCNGPKNLGKSCNVSKCETPEPENIEAIVEFLEKTKKDVSVELDEYDTHMLNTLHQNQDEISKESDMPSKDLLSYPISSTSDPVLSEQNGTSSNNSPDIFPDNEDNLLQSDEQENDHNKKLPNDRKDLLLSEAIKIVNKLSDAAALLKGTKHSLPSMKGHIRKIKSLIYEPSLAMETEKILKKTVLSTQDKCTLVKYLCAIRKERPEVFLQNLLEM